MLNRTAAHRRQLPRLGYAAGLLVLIGTVTALVVVVRIPAHSTTQSPPPAPPGPSAYDSSTTDGRVPAVAAATAVAAPTVVSGGDGHRNGTDAGRRATAASPPARSDGPPRGPVRAGGPDTPGDPTVDLHRSLVWSGLLGLIISLAGLGIVGSRRRMW